MARGDVPVSPFEWSSSDYLDRVISISIPYDNASRSILSGTIIDRDPGCLWQHLVWDVPTDAAKAKRSPDVPEGDTTLSAQQLRSATGFRVIEDVMAVQITAEP